MSANVQEINDLRKENMSLKRKIQSLELAQDIESYKKLAQDAWLDSELVGEREKVKELSSRVKVLEEEAKIESRRCRERERFQEKDEHIYWLQQQLAKSRAAAVELKKELTEAQSDVSHESEWRRQWKEKAVQSRADSNRLQKEMKAMEAQLGAAEEREQKLLDKLEGGEEQEDTDIVPGSPEQMKWFNGLSAERLAELGVGGQEEEDTDIVPGSPEQMKWFNGLSVEKLESLRL